MTHASPPSQPEPSFELRFQALFTSGRGYAFPCDAEGKVDPRGLSEEAHRNYLRALAAVGREFLFPVKYRKHGGIAHA